MRTAFRDWRFGMSLGRLELEDLEPVTGGHGQKYLEGRQTRQRARVACFLAVQGYRNKYFVIFTSLE